MSSVVVSGVYDRQAVADYYEIILDDLCNAVDQREDGNTTCTVSLLRETLTKYESMKKIQQPTKATEVGNESKSRSEKLEVAEVVDIAFDFQPSMLTNLLVTQILVLPSSLQPLTNCTHLHLRLLQVTQSVVELNPSVYLPAVASAVYQFVTKKNAKSNNNDESIVTYYNSQLSPELLQLWITLIANGSCPVSSVHEKLSESLLSLLFPQQQQQYSSSSCETIHESERGKRTHFQILFLSMIFEFLIQDHWKKQYVSSSDTAAATKKSNSIASIRCATFLIRGISQLQKQQNKELTSDVMEIVQSYGGLDLLLQMINDFTDPLQQLTLLDILTEEFNTADDNNNNSNNNKDTDSSSMIIIMNWLSSPEMMSPILQFLQDPLLCDAALRYVSMLSTMKPNEISVVLDHIRSIGSSIPTRETERLPLVHALSQAAAAASSDNATNALDLILSEKQLRKCWWDISRVSHFKLQCAILISIASTLPKISSTKKALGLYHCIGPDNNGTTTTNWLLSNKFRKSPMIELRIASYALLSSIFRVVVNNNASSVSIEEELGIDYIAKESLLELFLVDDETATAAVTTTSTLSFNLREAKYDLLESLMTIIIVATTSPTEGGGTSSSSLSKMVCPQKIFKQLQSKISVGPHGRIPIE